MTPEQCERALTSALETIEDAFGADITRSGSDVTIKFPPGARLEDSVMHVRALEADAEIFGVPAAVHAAHVMEMVAEIYTRDETGTCEAETYPVYSESESALIHMLDAAALVYLGLLRV